MSDGKQAALTGVTDLDEHALLVVRVGREDLLLARGDGRAALHQLGHDAADRLVSFVVSRVPCGVVSQFVHTDTQDKTCGYNHRHQRPMHLNPQGQGRDVDEDDVLGGVRRRAAQDGGLHGGPVGHGLVGVDALVELLAVEEFGKELLHLFLVVVVVLRGKGECTGGSGAGVVVVGLCDGERLHLLTLLPRWC